MDTPLTYPIVTYTVTLNGARIDVGGAARVSYRPPFNRIDINIKPQNTSLSYFEARVTAEGSPCDIGIGTLLCHETNITSAGQSVYFNITSETFPTDGEYRISLYSRNAVDGAWDVTYLFFTVGGSTQFVTSDGDSFEVLTKKNPPRQER